MAGMQSISYSATTGAIASVFLLGLVGYISVRRRILSHTGVNELSRVLVDFILPATLFNSMFSQYTPDKLPSLKWAASAQFFIIGVGATMAFIFCKLLKVKSHHGTVITLSSMQNNVYLPLPIAIALLSGAESIRAQFYVGCFVLFFTPVLWSVGVLLISGGTSRGGLGQMMMKALNPPFVAALAGLFGKMVFLKFGLTMPNWIMGLTKMAGDATTPLAMIVLGGILAEVKWSRDFEPRAIGLVAIIKLAIVPAAMLIALRRVPGIDPVFGFVALLEAACPAATNITIVAKRYGGNSSLVALTLLITYAISMITIPIWLVAY